MGVLTRLLVGLLCVTGVALAEEHGPPTAFWPEWGMQSVDPSVFSGSVGDALGRISASSGVLCVVPMLEEGGPVPPTFLSGPAKPKTLMWPPCCALHALHGMGDGYGYECAASQHCVALAPADAVPWLNFGAVGLGGGAVGAIRLAMATAPVEVGTRLASGRLVFVSELPVEARAAFAEALGDQWRSEVDAGVPGGSAVGLCINLVPAVEILVPGRVAGSCDWLDLGRYLPDSVSLRAMFGDLPRAIALTRATQAIRVLEWEMAGPGSISPPPDELVQAIMGFQDDWRLARGRLSELNTHEMEFDGGVVLVDDFCLRVGNVDPGVFAGSSVWTTSVRIPSGAALEGLAFALGANIVAQGDGLRLKRTEGFGLPEPFRTSARDPAAAPSAYRILLQWALESPPTDTAFGELGPDEQSALMACLSALEPPPAVAQETRITPGIALKITTIPLLLTRPGDGEDVGADEITLDVSGREDRVRMTSSYWCPYVTMDPFLLDL